MIKTTEQIELDYTKAMSQANELESIAEDLNSLANVDMSASLGTIKTAWSGENGDLFSSKAGSLQSQIAANARAVNKIAANIRKTAKSIRDADLKALAIASKI